MNFFEKIRLHYFRKALIRELASRRRERKIHTIWSARSIGILFDASAEADRREVLDFARALEKDGRKISLLGYLHDPKFAGSLPFKFFTPKMVSWPARPKIAEAETFAAEKNDLLLLVNAGGRLPLEWIAARAQASMKIGPMTENPNDFDFMLETPPGKDALFFLEQLGLYLDKVVPSGGLPKNRSTKPTNVQTPEPALAF